MGKSLKEIGVNHAGRVRLKKFGKSKIQRDKSQEVSTSAASVLTALISLKFSHFKGINRVCRMGSDSQQG